MNLRSIVLLSIFIFSVKSIDPYSNGPHDVQEKTYYRILTNGLDHTLVAWVPNTSGSFPVIYFNPGVGGMVPGWFYSIMAKHIASHGFVVLCPFALITTPIFEYKAEWLVQVDQWAQANLQDKLLQDGLNPGLQLDFQTTFLMGHSSGNHISINYLKLGCHNVKGVVLISPVDGVDPFGFIDDYCITPGEKLPFETPTLVISTGLDAVPGIDMGGLSTPACAPTELSNMRFYDALNGVAWLNNATLFGHVDFMNPDFVPAVVEMIKFCAVTVQDSSEAYLNFVPGQAVALFKGLMGNCELFEYLSNTDLMNTPVNVLKQGNGEVCPVGYCFFEEN